MRVLLDRDPFVPAPEWDASWVSDQRVFDGQPRVIAYRLRFSVETRTTRRIHVSADERYELVLDGVRLGRGPERGDRLNWFYETFDLELEPGEHELWARTWWLGSLSPYAQMTVRHGFLVHGEGLSTGDAPWEWQRLDGYEWLPWGHAWGTGAKVLRTACPPSSEWHPVAIVEKACTPVANDRDLTWRLRPAVLPPQKDALWQSMKVRHVSEPPAEKVSQRPFLAEDHLPSEAPGWESLPVTIPPRTRRRVLIDLDDYVCGYPEFEFSQGAGSRVRVHWLESLYERVPGHKEWIAAMPKGDRDQVEGKFFSAGVGDEFRPDGSDCTLDTLWWEAGRYLEVMVETADEPLVVRAFRIRETGYPYEFTSRFACSDAQVEAITPMARRVLEACSHETYMDCPYYEQIQYIGDTRLQALVSYVSTQDDRLARKAIDLLGASQLLDGLTQSRYPSRVTQLTFGFAIWWVGMVLDHALWRGDQAFVQGQLRRVRSVMDAVLGYLDRDGVARIPHQPNFLFLDWVPGWHDGPPVDESGRSAAFTFNIALGCRMVADLERMVGAPEMAAYYDRRARETVAAGIGTFYQADRGLLRDAPSGATYCEHAQVLALLAGHLPEDVRGSLERGLLEAPDLARATVYFTHYLFEVFGQLGRTDKLVDRLDFWFELQRQNLRTIVEMDEAPRSDCHAWGAHPVYHQAATILGIRPASFGFATVSVNPCLGSLDWAEGTVPHPLGEIHVRAEREATGTLVIVTLPEGLTGTCGAHSLSGGRQELRI